MIATAPSRTTTGQSQAIDQAYALCLLNAAGYACRAKGAIILVQDPEQSSIKGLIYRELTLNSNGDLRRFIAERS